MLNFKALIGPNQGQGFVERPHAKLEALIRAKGLLRAQTC